MANCPAQSSFRSFTNRIQSIHNSGAGTLICDIPVQYGSTEGNKSYTFFWVILVEIMHENSNSKPHAFRRWNHWLWNHVVHVILPFCRQLKQMADNNFRRMQRLKRRYQHIMVCLKPILAHKDSLFVEHLPLATTTDEQLGTEIYLKLPRCWFRLHKPYASESSRSAQSNTVWIALWKLSG